MRMLVVDDSATMRRIIVNTLRRIGYEDCIEAANAQDALQKCGDAVRCVLADWNMPGMSGLELVQQLRARPNGQQLKIIIVTTRSTREDILRAAHAGVNNYVVKPFTPAILSEKIRQVLSA